MSKASPASIAPIGSLAATPRSKSIDDKSIHLDRISPIECLHGAVLGLLPVVVALCYFALSDSFALGVDDSVSSFQPTWSDSFQQLSSGSIPLWSHHSQGGMPLYARGQGTFHPGALLAHAVGLGIGRPNSEIVICHLFHLWLGVLGCWLYLRNNGCCRTAAAIGAIGFAFSGPMWGYWTNWNSFAYLMGLLPLTLFVIDRIYASRRSWRLVSAMGLCTGMVTQLGDPQLMVKFLLLVVGYCLLRLPAVGRRDAAAMLFGGLALGGILGLAQCLAVADYISQTWRGQAVDAYDAKLLSLEPNSLTSLVDPFYCAEFRLGFYPGQLLFGAGLFFGPMLPLALGAITRQSWWSRPVSRAVTVLMIGYGLMSLGDNFPPNELAAYVPMLMKMRWPLRWSLELCMLGPLLIGLAVEDLLRRIGERRTLVFSAVGCAIAAALQVGWDPKDSGRNSSNALLVGHLVWWACFVMLLVFLARGRRRAFGAAAVAWSLITGIAVIPLAQKNRFSDPDLRQLLIDPLTAPIGEYERVLPLSRGRDRGHWGGNGNYCFNLAHQFGGRSVTGYWYTFTWQTWPFGFSPQGEMDKPRAIAKLYLDPDHKGLLQLLRIGAVLALRNDEQFTSKLDAHPDFEHIETTPWVKVYRHRGFREPAWFVKELLLSGEMPNASHLCLTDTPNEAICTVAEMGTKLSRQSLVAGKVKSFREHHDKIDIQVECPEGGFLVVNTTWHPDWKAAAGRESVPIVLTNGGFIGIPLKKGVTEISLRFQPSWRFLVIPLALGFWIIFAALAGGIIRTWLARPTTPGIGHTNTSAGSQVQ